MLKNNGTVVKIALHDLKEAKVLALLDWPSGSQRIACIRSSTQNKANSTIHQ
jgi:hypothetical protein